MVAWITTHWVLLTLLVLMVYFTYPILKTVKQTISSPVVPPVTMCYAPNLPLGTLIKDGNTITSKLEQNFRATLVRAGFPLYPASTAIIAGVSKNGSSYKMTPDIIVYPNVIIEIDHEKWHGDIKADAKRNKQFNKLGYWVYRVRVGKTIKPVQDGDMVVRDNLSTGIPEVLRRRFIKDVRLAQIKANNIGFKPVSTN